MISLDGRSLGAKLNPVCRRTLEAALGLTSSRTNFNVEIEHWLLKLLETPDSDVQRIVKQYDLDPQKISRELTKAIDKFKTGNGRNPGLSPDVLDLMREGWVLGSLEQRSHLVRSGHLLSALLLDSTHGDRIRAVSSELAKIDPARLRAELAKITDGTAEDAPTLPSSAGGPGPDGRPAGDSKTPSLDQFTQDLTARAKAGQLDPVIGRDAEIRQVIDILTRRRQNNPILTGEAGVGKTAVVEGFALSVAAGEVPDALKDVAVRVLDLGLLQAGAGVKGEFENRLKSVIDEVKSSAKPIILFIDEAHTLIGAGGAAGQGDAANLLKPALARGELRTVAATTHAEFKKFFESDPALKRRFQPVPVDEPDGHRAVAMLRGLVKSLEKHHRVRILDEAIEEAVRLSSRYITDRQLPDKAISVLDTACARVGLSQSATPPALEDCRKRIETLAVAIGIREREQSIGIDHGPALAELQEKKAQEEATLATLEARWTDERKLIGELLSRYQRLVGTPDGKTKAEALAEPETKAVRGEINAFTDQLRGLQGEAPLMHPLVNSAAVAEVVARWTGIPLGKMVRNEMQAVLTIADRLGERVVGQDHALETIARRIQTARAGLVDPRRPIGVFLLVGTSGVGKTETAVALADLLFGGERGLVVINMSEYKEDHKISRLTGAAPGYVGYGEGGVLTEAIRRKPNCVLLLDEVEKANVAVQEIFYQVFDKGILQDDRGTFVNFKNTIILLTSNAGTDTIMKVCADPDTRPDAAGLYESLRPDLLKVFKPALLGRMEVVPYFPLADDVLRRIVSLQLKRVSDRIREAHKAAFTYDDAVVSTILSRAKEVESGARNVDRLINGTILPMMATEILGRMVEGKPTETVHLTVAADGEFGCAIKP